MNTSDDDSIISLLLNAIKRPFIFDSCNHQTLHGRHKTSLKPIKQVNFKTTVPKELFVRLSCEC